MPLHPALVAVYQETIHSQTALIQLSDALHAGTATQGDWNLAEEALDAAHERLVLKRAELAPPSSRNWASPGFAGGPQAPGSRAGVTGAPPQGAASPDDAL